MLYISTSGHGYLRITLKQFYAAIARGFKPSTSSFINYKVALLEHDSDMPEYLKSIGFDFTKIIHDKIQEDINRDMYYATTKENIDWVAMSLGIPHKPLQLTA